MAVQKVKISELPLCENLEGLHTIGVDNMNRSVKVSLGYIKTQADIVATAGEAAERANKAAETVEKLVLGISAKLKQLNGE